MEQNSKNDFLFTFLYDNTFYLVMRDIKINEEDIQAIQKRIDDSNKKNITFVFDFENLSKTLDSENEKKLFYYNEIIELLYNFYDKSNKILNIVFKNCLIKNPIQLYIKDKDLNLIQLFISDELYSMSGHLDSLFGHFKPNTLVLKKMKINSKRQLNNFLDFISNNTRCKKLILEDIYIELLLKKEENDKQYNELNSYISFENGAFFINDKMVKMKKLKMIDCPLFAMNKDTFKEIKKYKDITIDIDENSLLNPDIITKFKINNGYSEICFDLDSYKINKDDSKDAFVYLYDIFRKNLYNNNDHEFKKLIFKNFDITKYEYITGENLTFIAEINWVLNSEEKKRKEIFEEKTKDLNKEIEQNKDKLSSIEELIFDNCSNYFIQLILKLINKKKFNLLKFKKCGKEYLDLKSILSLQIKNLILFDTPLIIPNEDNFEKEPKTHLSCYNAKLGSVENLTIKISCLEHYCNVNNLNYYNTIEIIVELINHENYIKNICFEMNALPIIMTFLVAKKYNKDIIEEKEKEQNKDFKSKIPRKIPTYFEFSNEKDNKNNREGKFKDSIKKRQSYIEDTFKLENLKNKKITLKKNNIKNRLENYDYLSYHLQLEKGRDQRSDFGSDIFNLDDDYKSFFNINEIDNIQLENCLFSNYINTKIKLEKNTETIINLLRNSGKNYIFDMKTLNEIIYKNKSLEDITSLLRYFSLNNIEENDISSDIFDYFINLQKFFENLCYIFTHFKDEKYLKNATFKFNNIKERKEFYCLLCIYRVVQPIEIKVKDVKDAIKEKEKAKEKESLEKIEEIKIINFKENYTYLPKIKLLLKDIEPYFLKEKNENDQTICSIFNYYYESEEEKKYFGDFGDNKVVEFELLDKSKFTFKVMYQDKSKWDDIIYDFLNINFDNENKE